MMPVLFTVSEVSAILKVTPQTVSKWIRRGVLPAVRCAKIWRVKEEDLRAFLSSGVAR